MRPNRFDSRFRARLLALALAALWTAACSDGGSGQIEGAGVNNGTPVAPPPPSGSTSLSLAWGEATGPVAGYAVFVQREAGSFEREKTVVTNRVELLGMPGETVRIAVAAYDTASNLGPSSEPSAPLTFPDSASPSSSASTASSDLTAPMAARASAPTPSDAKASGPDAREAGDAGKAEAEEHDATHDEPSLAGALLWRAEEALRVSGADLETQLLFAAPPDAELLGSADLDGDGSGDLLWSDGTTLSYTPLAHGAPTLGFGRLEPGESVVALGDFDGDGVADLLLRSGAGELGVWLTGAGAPADSLGIQGEARLAGVADFDADGYDDLAWRESDGALSLWLMRGTRSHASVEVVSDQTLEPVGAGDFDGDGAAELALRDASGALFLHVPFAGRLEAVGEADPASWRPVGAADVDGDGREELVMVGAGGLRFATPEGTSERPLDPASPWELVALLP